MLEGHNSIQDGNNTFSPLPLVLIKSTLEAENTLLNSVCKSYLSPSNDVPYLVDSRSKNRSHLFASSSLCKSMVTSVLPEIVCCMQDAKVKM